MNYSNQIYAMGFIVHLAPIQMGETEPTDFAVATRDDMEALWDTDEEKIMQAEFGML